MIKAYYCFVIEYLDRYNSGLRKIFFLWFLSLFANIYFIIDLLLIFIIYTKLLKHSIISKTVII